MKLKSKSDVPAPLVERVQAELVAAQRDLANAQKVHAELSLTLSERPEDAQVHQELTRVEAEVAEHQRRISRLSAALATAELRDAEEAKRANVVEMKANVAHVQTRFDDLTRLSLDIEHMGQQIAARRKIVAQLAEEIRRTSWATIRAACGQDAKQAERRGGILSVAAGTQADIGLAKALLPVSSNWVQITDPGRDTRPLEAQLAKDGAVLVQTLSNLVAQREAVLAGKVEAPPTQADRFVPGGKAAEERKQAAVQVALAGGSDEPVDPDLLTAKSQGHRSVAKMAVAAAKAAKSEGEDE